MTLLFSGIALLLVVDHLYTTYRRNPYGTWG